MSVDECYVKNFCCINAIRFESLCLLPALQSATQSRGYVVTAKSRAHDRADASETNHQQPTNLPTNHTRTYKSQLAINCNYILAIHCVCVSKTNVKHEIYISYSYIFLFILNLCCVSARAKYFYRIVQKK